MKIEVKDRLYRSMSNLVSKLNDGKQVTSREYQLLCFQFNYLFLNIKKDNQIFILDETEKQIIEDLLRILNQQNIEIPIRSQAKWNHSFFYFHLLKSWLNFTIGNFSDAKTLLKLAKKFPEETRAAETDHLDSLAEKQIKLHETLQQHFTQQPKQSIETPILSLEEFEALVNKYQSTNKTELLINASDETLARYFIDPKQQSEIRDPIALWNQNEPGSVSAMIKLICTMFTADRELSIDFFKDMHALALDGVKLPQANRSRAIIPGEFRKEAVQFGMVASKANSLAGFYDIGDWVEKQKIKGYRYNLLTSNNLDSITLQIFTTPQQIEEQLLDLINDYKADIANASSIRDVIKACAIFSHHFSLIHPFSDGNLRLSQQLLNFLLAKNNLPLCILSEPSLIEGASPDELVDHIVIGFHNFQHLMTKGYAPSTNDLEEINKDASSSSLIKQSIFKAQETKKIDSEKDRIVFNIFSIS
ncbi:Fic/DOC family [Legionella busanensis]|uniref:Fic/DOC family n=1 Tax=Legionella busanensis TaxID=190655 RepID=A0A378JKF0_9GAMM|nr:Fic family protein [Legionella busanensis]STX51557.1 Fic/DOC family [Legionella busanensis]